MEFLVALVGFVVFMVGLRVLNAYWQHKHRRARPPRHESQPQSQLGRVYKNPPPTNHNADPYSGWP